MREILDSVDSAIATGHFVGAIMMAMSVPDQCAAATAHNGQTSKARYIDWYNKFMLGGYNDPRDASGFVSEMWLSGADCYAFRCSLLHQGMGLSGRTAAKRIAFANSGIHKVIYEGNIVVFDVSDFALNMTRSARIWLDKFENDEPQRTNLARSIRTRDGLTINGVRLGGEIIA